MTEKRQSLRLLTFSPAFVIKGFFDTLQKSRVLQEAAVQQIVLLPVSPTCFQRE